MLVMFESVYQVDFKSRQRLLLQRVQPVFNFSQLVIIEPMVSAKGPSLLWPLREDLVGKTVRRKDAWPTLEAARMTYAKKNWDPRVAEVFVVRTTC